MKYFSCLVIFYFLILNSTNAQIRSRIFNGYNSAPQSWMVSIGRNNQSALKGHFCGGVLIEKSWVLTAAHCVKAYFNNPQKININYGDTNLNQLTSVAANGIIIHELYDEMSSTHDMALVHLSRPIEVQTLPIYTHDFENLEGAASKVYGWGLTKETQIENKPSESLQTVDMRVQSQETCRQGLPHNSYDNFTMMCAGVLSTSLNTQDGKDSCYGDSGGPLTTQVSGQEQLIGLVSWGQECASHSSYGVYTNIPNLRSWLDQPRTIPSYAITNPSVAGVAQVGKQISCKRPKVAYYSDYKLKYRWLDYTTGRTISKTRSLKLTRGLARHKLLCEVKIVGANASTYAYSKSTPSVRFG